MFHFGFRAEGKGERWNELCPGLGFTGNGKNGSHQILYGAPAGV